MGLIISTTAAMTIHGGVRPTVVFPVLSGAYLTSESGDVLAAENGDQITTE